MTLMNKILQILLLEFQNYPKMPMKMSIYDGFRTQNFNLPVWKTCWHMQWPLFLHLNTQLDPYFHVDKVKIHYFQPHKLFHNERPRLLNKVFLTELLPQLILHQLETWNLCRKPFYGGENQKSVTNGLLFRAFVYFLIFSWWRHSALPDRKIWKQSKISRKSQILKIIRSSEKNEDFIFKGKNVTNEIKNYRRKKI